MSPPAPAPQHDDELADFYERGPCGFHALDARGVIVAMNRTELELLQYERDQIVGKFRFQDLLAPLSKQRFVREFPAFKRRGRVDGLEFDLVRKDGATVPVRISATAVYDADGNYVRSRSVVMLDHQRLVPEETLQGAYHALEATVRERTLELTAVIATLREEIEERERAQDLLRQSEERAVAIVAAAVDGVITADENGFVETINPAAERIFGWRESELAGRNLAVLMPEPYASEHNGYLERYRTTGERRILGSERELVGRRRDGSTFPVQLAISEMHIGRRRLFRATARDLTEQKGAEERVAQLQAEVRRNEVLALIGSLVAGFAHEARNPLFGISAVLDALAARFGDATEYAQHFAMLRRDVQRLNDLMQDLLEFGRPSSELTAGAIGPVLAEAVEECTALASQRTVSIATRSEADEALVAMNARLVRAFQNLLQNAIQFAPGGSEVTMQSVTVVVDERQWFECTIRDRGPGVGADDLPHLFEPFFSRRRGGTGLGLAIVQRIVEDHRGQVSATNHPDGGAAITVRLPVAAG
jgi:PAS domain S-box-containing protein